MKQTQLGKKALKVADDFGLKREHDLVMLELLNSKKIDAISVLSEYVTNDLAQKLKNIREENKALVGLHFNLTSTPSSKTKKVKSILIQSILGTLDVEEVQNKLNKQIKEFEIKFNHMPDFIDGHEHVHSFPHVKDILHKTLVDLSYKGFIRNIGSRSLVSFFRSLRNGYSIKYLTLEILAYFQRKKLKKYNLLHNDYFEGILPLNRPNRLKNILEEVYSQDFKPLTLIMCHPGSGRTQEKGEHPSESREIEANFLRKLTS